MSVRVVVAGFGNVLRGDDGFGVEVVRRLQLEPVPEGVELLDVGLGGIHLVHVLGEQADGLVVLDALEEVERPPGTLLVVDPDVVDVDTLSPMARRDLLADMHYTTPDRALMLVRALDLLPARTLVVGCVPANVDELGEGLSRPVADAVEHALIEVRRIVTAFGVPWGDQGGA